MLGGPLNTRGVGKVKVDLIANKPLLTGLRGLYGVILGFYLQTVFRDQTQC